MSILQKVKRWEGEKVRKQTSYNLITRTTAQPYNRKTI